MYVDDRLHKKDLLNSVLRLYNMGIYLEYNCS